MAFDQVLYLSQSILDSLDKPKQTLNARRFLPLSISVRYLILSGTPLSFINFFWLAFVPALFGEINLSFLAGTLACCFGITKLAPFEFAEVFLKKF